MTGMLPISLAGESLWMHPDRALLWPAARAVLVADTHFGKSRIFRHHGIAVPAGADSHDRQRLTALLEEAGAVSLFVLGDFLHSALEGDDAEILALESWLRGLAPSRLCVIAGNHDRHVLNHWQPSFEWRTDALDVRGLTLAHDAREVAGRVPAGAVISGHIHPVWKGWGGRLNRLQAPVFWRNASGLVLPSFGSLTGGYRIQPRPGDELFVATDGVVLQVPRYPAT